MLCAFILHKHMSMLKYVYAKICVYYILYSIVCIYIYTYYIHIYIYISTYTYIHTYIID
jgi:hypothetical protein